MSKKQTEKKRFESKYTNYKKYIPIDGKEILVKFQNGIYETDNKKIIEALIDDPFVREVIPKDNQQEDSQDSNN